MTRQQHTLDSDSEDEWVGLPGDVDREEEVPANPREEAVKPPVAVGFEILGFQDGDKAGAKGPPKGLADRLAAGSRRREKKESKPKSENKVKKKRVVSGKRTEVVAVPEAAPNLDHAGIESEPRPVSPPVPLSDSFVEANQQLVSLLGDDLVRHLKSTRWQHRVTGLKRLEEAVHLLGVSKRAVVELTFPLIESTIPEAVFQVYSSGVGLLKYLLQAYLHDVPGDFLRGHVSGCVQQLIMRLGDVNGRVRDVAKDCLLALARHPRVGVNAVAEQATSGEICHGPDTWKITIGKINLMISLLEEHPIVEADVAFSVQKVMGLAVGAFDIVNQKVRKTATSLVVEIYKKIGSLSEKYLTNVPASILKSLKQEVEIEMCDVDAFKNTEIREQEEEDLSCLEPDLKLTPEQQESITRWSSLLNSKSIVCIMSKKWKLRDHVFTRLTATLATSPLPPDANYQLTRAVFEAYTEIAEIGISDAIPQLLVSCMTYLTALIKKYENLIAGEHLRWHLSNNIIHKLIGHVSGATSVVTQAASDLLKQLSRNQKLGVAYVSNIVMQPDYCKSGQNWKMMLARLTILNDFVQEFDFKEKQLSTEAVMGYAVGCFQCTNGKVRSAAVNVIIEVYKKCGNIIRVYLKEQKPTLLNELKEKIAKVARKDRTKSAPIQTLASIVQPLGVDNPEAILPCRPSTFPAALETEDSLPPDTIRQRIQRWKTEQAQMERASNSTPKNGVSPSSSKAAGPISKSSSLKKSGIVCPTVTTDIVLPQKMTSSSRLVLG
eukprot:TRINITY_DN57_c4_g1_i2.p1 TRINITY_DN57_c4_g1~~TRINITY_DN57_c4_g1_i2.p1  ORF type:complete len:816 (+),score=133.32 TRINITY_DN57_c4_g1_i2:124-2448(+)